MTFVEALEYGLAMKDMSRRNLAKEAGVSASTVTNWLLHKRTPQLAQLECVAKVLNLTMPLPGEWRVLGAGIR